MLWRRSDNIVFALVLGGADLVSLGDGVECQVKGTLQVLDDTEGPTTKREYQEMMVPGERGKVWGLGAGGPLQGGGAAAGRTAWRLRCSAMPGLANESLLRFGWR